MAGFEANFRNLFISMPANLSLKNENLLIKAKDKDPVMVPLKDISCVILDDFAINLTHNLLSAFAKENIVLLSSDKSCTINGIFFPFCTHFQTNEVIKMQINAPKQLKAILWQQIIKVKIQNQARILEKLKLPGHQELMNLQKNVLLGDSKNLEAKAAMKYFPLLFGKGFTRKKPCWINSALNYAYSIIRALIIKNITASGMLGVFGIKHDNIYNNFNLADDLIEVFRPFCDELVFHLFDENKISLLSKEDKKALLEILNTKICINSKTFGMQLGVANTVQSYKNSINLGLCELGLPRI